ncbi:hypothetical protein VP01_8429g1, partial [Puccinia sorghi]
FTTHAKLINIYVVTLSNNVSYTFIPSDYHHLMSTESTFGHKDEIKTRHHLVFLMLHERFNGIYKLLHQPEGMILCSVCNSTCVASVLRHEQHVGYSGFQKGNRVQNIAYPNIHGQQVSHTGASYLSTTVAKAQHLLNPHSTMPNLLCLEQFIIPLHCPTPISLPEFHQPAFLHRGTSQVHIWCYPRHWVADLSQLESEMIGPLLGQI